MKLGVNIDHVATVRQARGTAYPSVIEALQVVENTGATSIVAHLREDRRHIQDKDVFEIKKYISIPFNLEMSIHPSVVEVALQVKPHHATIVPEKRKELTTEGGLDLTKRTSALRRTIQQLQHVGINVSLFIDPDKEQIDQAKKLGVGTIELNTGSYAEAKTKKEIKRSITQVMRAAEYARKLQLFVAAGHGIDYNNVHLLTGVTAIQEFNIGYAIIARAIFVGLPQAIRQMMQLINRRQ